VVDLEEATRASRYIERVAYGLLSDAEGAAAVREAEDVLRLAKGLRRMLERVTTAREAGAEGAPTARKEE